MFGLPSHGDGWWNNVARAAGLNRTGKSCRLRWLNYLRPGVRRGSFTPEEQGLIVELQSRWGNRWSKIAKHLPGRTDNKIKNFWRTKIQKKRKQLGEAGAAVFVTADGQTSTNTSQESSTLLLAGVSSADLSAATSMFFSGHHHSLAAVHGGGGGVGVSSLPEFVAESSDNFSWTFEEVWPAMAPMQPFNFSI
ncbi:hypothetical protein E2562_022584 [Oryza meyeriana var. granulata]|uniref:Uncharacterized protein n=1 Tax=Oryza meyeriana var. granulata TaxID=110450 RepID=A0A6G1CR37_9ORYZ|nr:hypothetical protein E2562_022584 [Oryza meyeriana var. granulata]